MPPSPQGSRWRPEQTKNVDDGAGAPAETDENADDGATAPARLFAEDRQVGRLSAFVVGFAGHGLDLDFDLRGLADRHPRDWDFGVCALARFGLCDHARGFVLFAPCCHGDVDLDV